MRVSTVAFHLLPNASGGQVHTALTARLQTRQPVTLKSGKLKNIDDFSVIFCCPSLSGSMTTDYELYYGFTRFAIELNELCPELKDVLPRTDARFRPDQRYCRECCLLFCTDKIADSVIPQIILYFVCRLQTDDTARSPGCIYCMCRL